MKRQQKQLGIALGGGGPRGMAHLGVLHAFDEVDIRPDMISGTSIGALIAALYAFGVSPEDMKEAGARMGWNTIARTRFSRYGLASNEKIKDIMKHLIGDKDISDASTKLIIVATDISTGEKIVMQEGDVSTAVMASSSIPGMFAPVEINGRMLVEGGLTENVPVSALRDAGAASVVGVDVLARGLAQRPQNAMSVIINAMCIATHTGSRYHTQHADVLIEPEVGQFVERITRRKSKDSLLGMYEEGYRQGKVHIDQIKSLL